MLSCVTLPQERDDLDEYEAWARARLEPLLGPLRVTDRRGGPEGLHDCQVGQQGEQEEAALSAR